MYFILSCHILVYCIVLYYDVLCIVLCYFMLYCVMFGDSVVVLIYFFVLLCGSVLCYAVLCYVMLCFGRSGFYDEVTTLITGKVLVLFLHDKILETIHNIYSSIINSFRQQNTTKIQPSIYK